MNGSGKSTILQSLAALKQSYLLGRSPGLRLGGSLVQLGNGSDVLSEGAASESVTITLIDEGTTFSWVCEATADTDELRFLEAPNGLPRFIAEPDFQYLQADRVTPQTLYPRADQHSRSAGFLGSRGEYSVDFLARSGELTVPEMRMCTTDSSDLPPAVWAHVAPTAKLLDQVAGWLQHVSPGAQLSAERIRATDNVLLQYRYYGGTSGRSNHYRPTHVGFGLTYVLPILVACLSAPRGSLLLLENPEAHLHPHGQAKIGELLARCAADGVQVVVETHSDHILNGIRLAVKHRVLSNEFTRICFFSRDMDTGDSFIGLPSLLPNGQLTNWPPGFFDQWEKSLDALLG